MHSYVINSIKTMSSREIAELLGTRHDNVKVSVERLAKRGAIGTPAAQEFIHNGNTYTEYLLNKRDSLILVAQNCPEFTAVIVDRWQELEAKQPEYNIPTTLSGALRLAAEQAETIEKQAAQIEAAKPAIAFAERHANANNLLSIRAAAKALRFPEQAFIAAMIRDGFLYRDQSGRIMPYANRQFAGLFDVTTGEANGHAYVQAKITPAGMQKMACRYASELGE